MIPIHNRPEKHPRLPSGDTIMSKMEKEVVKREKNVTTPFNNSLFDVCAFSSRKKLLIFFRTDRIASLLNAAKKFHIILLETFNAHI